MSDFVSLASRLRDARVATPEVHCSTLATVSPAPDELRQTLQDVRRFRAHMQERFECDSRKLLRRLADDVLGRELRIAPCDIASVLQRLLRSWYEEEPLQVLVHPEDVQALHAVEVPVREDPAMQPGDLRITLKNGEIRASLRVRIEEALNTP